ncbi:S8 family serine peptidase [Streptomyces sp. LP05-1]|uniref:S8 family serine peptidase n=1 Tax=Streptomyces pyxinae TaxID=2970734 RepID=A0ABT2CGQ9_9ACTN|nr:S8 family serine peptidase [Streptomyces sp. LP05-1]MCS0636495.1 S8 family serine peptidase [Streptomyces sp. LP05-1]
MHVEEMWKKTTGEGIKVAVIDSGVNPSTPALKGQVLKGKDLSGTPGEETDDYRGHGTSVAELIAGTGKGGGLQGVAPGAKIIPFRISDTELQDEVKVNGFDQEQAIRAAADSEAQIINVSMAGEFTSFGVRDAVHYAFSKGKLIFAGAGNNGNKDNKLQYPASFTEVVAVAATDPKGKVADFSQHGESIDIAAPGVDIPSWCDETLKRYCEGTQGTSFSTAIASGGAALIWSAHPDWTANQVLRVMFESAGRSKDWTPGSVSNYLGHGISRPAAHINRGLGKPGDPDISPLTDKRSDGKPTAPASPSPSPARSGEAAGTSGEPGAPGPEKAAATDGGGGGRTALIVGGAVAAVLVVGGAVAFARRRRQRA